MAVNRTKVLEAAQKFLAKNQYDKAIAEYQKLVAEDPRDVRTLLKIGDLHTRRSKPKDAIDIYLKVAELYAKQGFFLKAVAVYKQILKLEPTHLESSLRLAKMYEELGLTSDALTTYESVADAYVEQGAMPKALETMERMVELEGANIAVRIKYAEALSRASRPKDAALAFAAGARLLKEQGRMDDYLRVVERQLYHDPDNVLIARELSSLYLERTDPKRALTKLQICFKADPRDVQTLEMLAEAFRQLGQLPKTISVLKEIARLHGELGAQEPRRRTLQRVLELDPNDAEAKLAAASVFQGPGTGQIQMPQGKAAPAEARPAPQAAVEQDEEELDDVELEIDSTDSDDDDVEFVDEGDEEEVLLIDEDLSPSVDSELIRPEHLLEQADLLEADEQYDEAERLVQRILEQNPEHEEAHERLKDLYLATDRRVDAVRELLWLSEALHEKNPERAIQHARTAYDLAPNAEATQNRLRALGVSVGAEISAPNPGFARKSTSDIDDELAAFLDGTDAPSARSERASMSTTPPPLARRSPSSNAPSFSSTPPSYSSAPPRVGVDRATVPDADDDPIERDVLDIELQPGDFDALPPVRIADIDPTLFLLLETELRPEDFGPEAPVVAAAVFGGADAPEADDAFDPLLDAPISPDEFDAPPPARVRAPEFDERARELLERPLATDDFGLSDERFYDSGLMEVEAQPAPANLSEASFSTDDDLFETGHPPAPDSDGDNNEAAQAQADAESEDAFFADEDAGVTLPPEADSQTLRPGLAQENVAEEDDFATAPPQAPVEPLEPEAVLFTGLEPGDSGDGFEEDLLPGAAPTVPGAPIPELLLDSGAANLEVESLPDRQDPPAAEDAPEAAAAERAAAEQDSLATLPPFATQASESDRAPESAETDALSEDAELTSDSTEVAPQDQAVSWVEAEAEAAPEPEAAPEAEAEHAPEPEPESASVPQVAAAEAMLPEIEEVLDEADFFASQGMMEEALELIQEAILIYPGNGALRARLLQYEAEADAQDEAQGQAADNADDSFDIAEQLASELAEVTPGSGDEMVDVESVFAQFKKGVAAQIAPEDSDTHFDLGIAYKEMGLTEDAIAEFALAAKNTKRACTSLTMIGMCYLEKGNAQSAVSYFEQALATPVKSPLEDMALHYELGNAQEQLGKLDLALSEFERVAAQDRTFRGVLSRLDSLKRRGAVA